MGPSSSSEPLECLLLEAGLVPGGLVHVGDGNGYRAWLRYSEPVVVVAEDDEAGDLAILHRLAWSSGCPCALVSHQGRIGYINTLLAPSGLVLPRLRNLDVSEIQTFLAHLEPCSTPGVVDVLVERMQVWRAGTFRRALSERTDWTEEELSLAIEKPIHDLLLGDSLSSPSAEKMDVEIKSAGVDLSLVPPELLALAWDRHLSRRLRVQGGASSLVGSTQELPVPTRPLLTQFAQWAVSESKGIQSVLIPACGAGRLLLHIAEWARANRIGIYAMDPDPRATLFATRLLERVAGDGLSLVIRSGNPLVDDDLFEGAPGQLIPGESRSRLRAVDWMTVFGGVREFDRVLVGDPVLSMTRRREVRRYLEERYRSAGSGTDPSLLLAEAGACHLRPGGRILALYASPILRSDRATSLRRWLAPRTEVSCVSTFGQGAVALRIAPDPVETSIVSGSMSGDPPEARVYPRTALQVDGWWFNDAMATERRRLVVTGCTPLGEVLVGGIRPVQPYACNPALLIEKEARRLIVGADRRASRLIRPVVGPDDLVSFGTARDSARFMITGVLPSRASRVARRLGIHLDVFPDKVPPLAGPRLLFKDGVRSPVFLCDHHGEALTSPGIAEVLPANLMLLGLLHSRLIRSLLEERCPRGVTTRCLHRLPIRLPDPYDPRERRLGDQIVSLVRARIRAKTRGEPVIQRHLVLESAIEVAIEDLYGLSADRDQERENSTSAP